MARLPGDEADDDEGIALGKAKLGEDGGVGGEAVWVEVGELVVAIISDLLFTEISRIAGGGTNCCCERIRQLILQFTVLRIVE